MRKNVLVMAFLIALVAPAVAQKAQIEAVNAKWMELFNKSDFDGIAQLYTVDYLVEVLVQTLHGSSADAARADKLLNPGIADADQ